MAKGYISGHDLHSHKAVYIRLYHHQRCSHLLTHHSRAQIARACPIAGPDARLPQLPLPTVAIRDTLLIPRWHRAQPEVRHTAMQRPFIGIHRDTMLSSTPTYPRESRKKVRVKFTLLCLDLISIHVTTFCKLLVYPPG